MLNDDCQSLFDQFVPMARQYLDSPGVMAALELDQLCMKLYPAVAREKQDQELSNMIRDFGRGLPRKEADELAVMFDGIIEQARVAGLNLPA
ncbi:hypothetical protein [Thiolapillus brandeum]|uniref:hypothetical protein n=1 Tax=Thiolapillus brandeum TaxID=1076588 RepID=UPI0005972796|nr:hypothetical protein [Thiolapillus brandeum]